MGTVYAAQDLQLGRRVAIKVLPARAGPAPRSGDELWARFVLEGRAASALNHPNIVVVHDIRSEGGVDFIVIEYLEDQMLH